MSLTADNSLGMMGLRAPAAPQPAPGQPPIAAPQPAPGQPPAAAPQAGQPPAAAPQPAPGQPPAATPMLGQPKQSEPTGKEYNGEIDIDGKKVKVTDGVVEGSIDQPGKKIFVSADGKVVWDNTGKVLGSVDADGKFVHVTKEQIDELAKKGVVKAGQAPSATPNTPPAQKPQ